MPKPPLAVQKPCVHTHHGDHRSDPYHWLREREHPDVSAYIEAERAYTTACLQPTETFQEQLYREMRARVQEDDCSVPWSYKGNDYVTRNKKGAEFELFCRRPCGTEQQETVLLDENQLADGHTYCEVGCYSLSLDQRYLIYSLDTEGDEQHCLFIKDLDTGTLFPEQLENTSTDAAWCSDHQHFFYVRLDDSLRPYRVYRHRLGETAEDDVCVWHEPDERFWVSVSLSKTEQFIFITSASKTSTEVLAIPVEQPLAEPTLLCSRQADVEAYAVHHGQSFYWMTNFQAKNFCLMRSQMGASTPDQWQCVLPYIEAVHIEAIEVFRDYLVLTEREQGLAHFRVLNLNTHEHYRIPMFDPVYAISSGDNMEPDTNVLRFEYTSLTCPHTVFDYDLDSRQCTLKKRTPVLGGYLAEDYCSERLWIRSHDGTQVPLSLVYHKTLKKDGSHPCLLYGYGAYGSNLDVWFSHSRLSLLERGFVFAIAHVRGSSELGEQWHEQGKLLNKRHSFEDFIACSEALIAKGYSSAQRLVSYGASAGGLLVTAAMNRRPDLYAVVVADVPFVDVLNTMLDASLPLTVTEYEEWGDPNQAVFYEYIKSYSPYDNITAQPYPALLIQTGLQDTRVPYWEALKFIAKMRQTTTGKARQCIKINDSAGHAGVPGRYQVLKDIAFEDAFILQQLDLLPKEDA